MANDFSHLGQSLRIRSQEVTKWGFRTPRRAAKILTAQLIRSTPVDVGTTRSNWQVNTGTKATVPFAAVRPAFSPGKKLGLRETQNANAAIADANARIDRAPSARFIQSFPRSGLSGTPEDTVFFVSNPVPWINILDAGHSKQQKAGFVNRAISFARIRIRKLAVFDRLNLLGR